MVPLAIAVMEDLSGSAYTTHPAPAVCLLIDTWDDPGVLPSGGHIHLPVGHSEGQAMDLCMSSWQPEFGWHLLLIDLLGWRKGQGDGWAMATGAHRLETPCPLSAPFPLILPRFPGAMELGNPVRERRVIGDQGNRMVPVPQCVPQAAVLGQCQPCWQLCQRLRIPETMSQFP